MTILRLTCVLKSFTTQSLQLLQFRWTMPLETDDDYGPIIMKEKMQWYNDDENITRGTLVPQYQPWANAWQVGVTQVLHHGGNTSGGKHGHDFCHYHGHSFGHGKKKTLFTGPCPFCRIFSRNDPNIAGHPAQRTRRPQESCQRTPVSLWITTRHLQRWSLQCLKVLVR